MQAAPSLRRAFIDLKVDLSALLDSVYELELVCAPPLCPPARPRSALIHPRSIPCVPQAVFENLYGFTSSFDSARIDCDVVG